MYWYSAGDIEEAKVLQKHCADITGLVMTPNGYEQPAVQKAVLSARLGINCGAPRLPVLPLKPEIKESGEAHFLHVTAPHYGLWEHLLRALWNCP